MGNLGLPKVNEKFEKKKRPIKVLQFGEGNFLRGFADYMLDAANADENNIFDGSAVIVKPIEYGSLDMFHEQECVYTVILRGKKDGETSVEKRVITCVDSAISPYESYSEYAELAKLPELRFIVSNATEAGIVYDESDRLDMEPPKTYPGKLTKFLYNRFTAFDGAADKGLIILPMELIEKNGAKLKDCCLKLARLWDLPSEFSEWVEKNNVFCGTLVDRIVTGYPKDEAAELESELGYSDSLIVTGEPFALWVIESDEPEKIAAELPLDKAGLPVIFTNDQQPYRERKVRILNGAHTSTVLAAYLGGLDTVGECMKDKTMRAFMEKAVFCELSPMVPLPADEVKQFAESVMERFENPFIKHSLLSISLNSVSKFKSRVLPTIKETKAKTGNLPDALTFSLAALMAFYSGKMNAEGKLVAKRGGDTYEIMDDAAVLSFFAENAELPADTLVQAFLSRVDFWGENLAEIPGLCGKVAGYLQSIRDNGARAAVEKLL